MSDREDATGGPIEIPEGGLEPPIWIDRGCGYSLPPRDRNRMTMAELVAAAEAAIFTNRDEDDERRE
ncbi:hypothetical protein [Nocardia brasiliensis]|uniref:hypothetical protein n=1 Tax=Nocardia brasiliensis TaxID=37326 RepID=UPI00245884D1|nr:hypothetical protein [Nocardia brasiliensis]